MVQILALASEGNGFGCAVSLGTLLARLKACPSNGPGTIQSMLDRSGYERFSVRRSFVYLGGIMKAIGFAGGPEVLAGGSADWLPIQDRS